MKNCSRFLFAGAICNLAIALLHIAIIIGGGDWYRFWGAGEEMASMAEAGSLYPAFLTAGIAVVFVAWSAYGFSGAGLLRPLPFIRPVLVIVAGIYLVRGLGAIPLVFLTDHPYFTELSVNVPFMIMTSLVSLSLGLLHAVGTKQSWSSLRHRRDSSRQED